MTLEQRIAKWEAAVQPETPDERVFMTSVAFLRDLIESRRDWMAIAAERQATIDRLSAEIAELQREKREDPPFADKPAVYRS